MDKFKCIVLVCALCALLGAQAAFAATVTILPSDDAYVHSGSPNVNFGVPPAAGNNSLDVGDSNSNDPAICTRSYLKFDLSAIPAGATVTSATVNLYIWGIGNPTSMDVDIHYLGDDSWSEGLITWNNAPTTFNVTPTDTQTVSTSPVKWWAWDVLADVQTALSGDSVLSEVLRDASEDTRGRWAGFDSTTASTSSFWPYLQIDYQVGGGGTEVLKFQQLPLDGPTWGTDHPYYGHDEVSTMVTAWGWIDPPAGEDPILVFHGYEGCYMADDFADLKDTPVTKVKWWGSYLENLSSPPPTQFLIVFEADIPADESTYGYSIPGEVLHWEIVDLHTASPPPAGSYTETLFSNGGPPCNEKLYEYEATLATPFPEQKDTVYWIKIVALVDIGPVHYNTLLQCAATNGLTLCDLLKMSYLEQIQLCGGLDLYGSIIRWGWHNRDYTLQDTLASTDPAVVPGEKQVGTVTGKDGTDLPVWHFQDDAVSGDIQFAADADATNDYLDPEQQTFIEEKYKYSLPYCTGTGGDGVDGPDEIENFSKDLAFELYTREEGEPDPDKDFGDAPEDGIAYPSTGVVGAFPTCKNAGPAGHIEHGLCWAFFGSGFDFELDGDAGFCPAPGCFPTYDDDECFADGDAGLMFPDPYTIDTAGSVVPCPNGQGTPLGKVCQTAVWGTDIDIIITNGMPVDGYVNVLMDWNQDGTWAGSSTCPGTYPAAGTPVPEHVLVDVVVPMLYSGPLSGIIPAASSIFQIGPKKGYVWTRFSVTESPVGDDWNGEGTFEDGETEDYLLEVAPVGQEVIKFQQLPLDGPKWGTQHYYYGHDELSTIYGIWYGTDPEIYIDHYEGCFMADDFADTVDHELIRVRWWGSYLENEMFQAVYRFMIVFETDVPADDVNDYSHPGQVIQSEIVHLVSGAAALNPGEYTETTFSSGGPPCDEILYEYEALLKNPFPQEPDTVYWIKIVAMVDADMATMSALGGCLIHTNKSLCEFLNLPYAQQFAMCDSAPQLTRWGWHNRDYTVMNPFASPNVTPGEFLAGVLPGQAVGDPDLEIWHFQDDAVSGEMDASIDAAINQWTINQWDYLDEYYVWQWPFCFADGVDGPREIVGVDFGPLYSKDLAFELWGFEPECFPMCHPDYSLWAYFGKIDCWCYPYQCFGNTNMNFSGLNVAGKRKWVELSDLQLLGIGWMKKESFYIGSEICADFNRLFSGLNVNGKRKWIELGDLQKLGANWMKKASAIGTDTCLDCP